MKRISRRIKQEMRISVLIVLIVLIAYHEGATFIGDIVKNAMEDFYMSTDFSNKYNRIPYFEFVLLGDPALELPAQQQEHLIKTKYNGNESRRL